MAEHTLAISVVTPRGIVFERDEVKMAIVNTISGSIGIMANHQPIISALKIDEVKVINKDDSVEHIAVNSGFAEFSNNKLTIVSESSEIASGIDVDRAKAAKDRAQGHITHAKEAHDADELARAEIALARAVNRIKIVTSKK